MRLRLPSSRQRNMAVLVLLAAGLAGVGSAAASFGRSAPPAPTGLAVTAEEHSLTLSWDPVASATGYGLYLDGQGQGATASTSWTFSGLACGTSHRLEVAAGGGGSTSPRAGVNAATNSCSAAAAAPPAAASSPGAASAPEPPAPEGAAVGAAVASSGTFGSPTPGSLTDTATADLKEVSKYTAPEAARVSKLTGYVSGLGSSSGTQPVRAIIYANNNGNPGALLGVSSTVTISAGRAWGWVDFTFPSAVSVAAGTVWMGYIAGSKSDLTQLRYDSVANELHYNTNSGGYAAGPSNPFGTPKLSQKHYSLYATYTPASAPPHRHRHRHRRLRRPAGSSARRRRAR